MIGLRRTVLACARCHAVACGVPLVDRLRLVGAPETNRVMMGELARLARRSLGRVPSPPTKLGSGTLCYPYDEALAKMALRYHRTCTRVLHDVAESVAPRLEPLYEQLCADVASDTRLWLFDGATISIAARNVDAFAAGPRQIVGAVKNAVIDGAKKRGIGVSVRPNDPDVSLSVRMHDNTVSLSIDLAGRSLSQRGYRVEKGAAPLREHLAAALVMLARFDWRTDVLLDPMCGAGTIPIEAALMALAAPLTAADRAVHPPLFGDAKPVILASDHDVALTAKAQRNARAAGVLEDIEFSRNDFRDVRPTAVQEQLASRNRAFAGVILTNTPYGRRLDSHEGALYRDLATWCRQFAGWRAGFLVGSDDLEQHLGRPRIRKPLRNGGLSVQFLLYDL